VIDLHSHSTASDGSYSPSALVGLALERGLKALALTDHDSVAGIPEAEAAAAGTSLRLIRGVEMEIAFGPGEFHLLGLRLGDLGGEIAETTARLARSRDERNGRIIWRLNNDGIPATIEELRALAGEGVAGRPHIAALMVKYKAVRTRQEAFDKYLAKGRPFYEAKDCLGLAEAMRIVKDSGGLAIVAHPLSLFVSWGRLGSLMDEWKELGIDGIEAFHPTAKLVHCRRVEKMAKERGFRITAGSDFHGAIRPDRKLGRTAGDLPIGDEYLSVLDS
jgi:3',5'-nucleoside bisphosphate phosphatase